MYYWSVVILLAFPLLEGSLASEPVEKRNYCGRALANALQTICGPGGYFLKPTTPGRVTRLKGVVDECCLEPCTTAQLRQYCDLYATSLEEPGQLESTSSTQKPRPTEKRKGPVGKKRRSRCKKRCRCHKKRKQRKPRKNKKPKQSGTASTTSPSVAHFEYFDDWRGPLFDLS